MTQDDDFEELSPADHQRGASGSPGFTSSRTPEASEPTGSKWWQIGLLAVVQVLAMGLWFSASAVVPQLRLELSLSEAQASWITMSVQVGFVLGAALSALLNISDRVPAARLFAVSAMVGAVANAAIAILPSGMTSILVLRFLTGMALAGVYPPAMKLVASWTRVHRGLGIGIVVGALTLGKALPHLVSGLPIFGGSGPPPWRGVVMVSSATAAVAGLLALVAVRAGPYLTSTAPFDFRFAMRSLRDRPTRLANFGYLGHMWELYAMWTWVPIYLIAAYDRAGWSLSAARFAGFATIAAGALGSVLGGRLADRIGRTKVTIVSLALSGGCALIAGLFFESPGLLTAVCIIWGVAVVADSAQFSTAISELADSRYVGTALTLQTSLGFLLTLFTIRWVPEVREWLGDRHAFEFLALGPAFGIWSMWRLRAHPDATKMAGGKR